MKLFQIAIDGPVAAGKSTAAKRLAEKLGILYLNSGAMYRAVALKARQHNILWEDEAAVTEMLHTTSIELVKPSDLEQDNRLVTVLLDGQDVSNAIQSSEIAEGASIISTYEGVRTLLVELQRNLAHDNSVVMEGRDIGTVVLPQADLKIYLDATLAERVRRKWQYLQGINQSQTVEEVEADLTKRDQRKLQRAISPLTQAEDAWLIDTTNTTLEEVIELIYQEVLKRRGSN